MDAQQPTRRRWWHSHEWTALVVIGIIATLPFFWLGWQSHLVHFRRAVRQQIEESGGAFRESTAGWFPANGVELIRRPVGQRSISWIRELLGDRAVPIIVFDRQPTAAAREAIDAFPEADVVQISDSPPAPGQRVELF